MASLLDSVTCEAPALQQAQRISEKAVGAGFEWDSVDDVWEKVKEEIEEFLEAEPGSAHRVEEFGDVLFTLVNVARKEGIEAESALQGACDKFRGRWSTMEQLAQERLGSSIEDIARDQLEDLWSEAKAKLE